MFTVWLATYLYQASAKLFHLSNGSQSDNQVVITSGQHLKHTIKGSTGTIKLSFS
jgi:hypothetical protein